MKRYNQNEIELIAKILKEDGVVSVPTDTVYGLCASISSKKAYEKLVKLKNRPSNKYFPVMCSNEEQVKQIAIVDSRAEKLIHAFMPGPLTLILRKKEDNKSVGNQTSDKIAVRIAPLKVLEDLVIKLGNPIFLTSANISGEKECNNLEEIEKVFPTIDGILEGKISYGKASTIVDCTDSEIKIVREGPISEKEIKNK